MTTPNYMAQLGATLVERGFAILPIQPRSKKPGMYRQGAWHDYPQWSRHCTRATSAHELDIWSDWPESGIGVAAGLVIGIDIDVLDARVGAQIEGLAKRLLGDTPAVRIGRAPKRLLVYRAVEPFAGFKYPPIEVLGQGQQFIAYGVHPQTGQEYDWPVHSLVDLKASDLPAITAEQARAFALQALALIPAEQRPNTLGLQTAGAGSPSAAPSAPEQRGTLAAVEEALTHIVNADLDYDSWVRIGLALKGALGEAGWPLFERWSASSQKFEPKATAAAWRSFAPQRIGAGTLYKLALGSGWQPSAGLQLNGELASAGPHPAQRLLDGLLPPSAPAHGPVPPKPLPPGWDALDGVLGEMMQLMIASAKRPQPVLALGASLCALGALMGRKYRTASNIRSNLYVVGIAESGAGKNHSRVVINELFRRAKLLQYLGGNKIASGAGLLTAIQRQPAILFQLDEFGMFLAAAADRKRSPRYVTEILDLLTELYTTSGTTYFGVEYASTQHNDAHRAIHQPCACIYGSTTPLHFWQALQAANVADGSLARFLILQSEDDFPDSNEAFGVIDPPPGLLERLILIHEGGGQLAGNLNHIGAVAEVQVEPLVVPTAPEALAVFRALDQALLQELRQARGSGLSSILARIEENATKLALIRAVARDPVRPQIEQVDAAWGVMLARHCADLTLREVAARVSENPTESNHKRALKILQDAGVQGMSKSEFTRRTQFMDLHQRDSTLKTLIEAGFVSVEQRQARGRPGQWLRYLGEQDEPC